MRPSVFLLVALALGFMTSACDPTFWYYEGEVTSVEDRRVCIRASDPSKYQDQPNVVGKSTVCGRVRSGVAIEISTSMCVKGAYVNFPSEVEKPPAEEVLWASFEKARC